MRLHLVPLVNIADLDFSERDRSVTMTINSVLHGLKLLHLLMSKLVAHEVEQGKLAYAVQYSVHHLDIERGAQKESQGHHFLGRHFFRHFTLFSLYLFLKLLNLLKVCLLLDKTI